MKVLPAGMIKAIKRLEAERIQGACSRAAANPSAARDAHHMAQKVRALSYRVPLAVRCGDRGFTYSISGWYGAV